MWTSSTAQSSGASMSSSEPHAVARTSRTTRRILGSYADWSLEGDCRAESAADVGSAIAGAVRDLGAHREPIGDLVLHVVGDVEARDIDLVAREVCADDRRAHE